ncbi:NAD-dependent epimerase/dehydratase family protein [Stutzerimonas kunmingensis]|uniref:NAD-dependent epimerase/dehydratase family protein n=1 Tax=Stutzerimonas kunmingensis TaxID=1211807 RepID=UPI0028A60F33|nr:NAD-dependent epimerase/dehydratase family protein [Stutzerimonas kunmingensis]
MTMSVLVTGAAGFTGRAVCQALLQKGCRVHGLVSRACEVSGVLLHTCNLSDKQGLVELLDGLRVDQVVHLAARAFVASEDLEAFYRTNVVGTCNLLDAARDSGVSRVIVASSANIYGVPPDASPLRENAPPAPVNHYAASKLAMEHLARTYAQDFSLVITRPFNYTGPQQDPAYLVPKLVASFNAREPQIQLGNLDVARDFSSLDDVVRAYLALVERPDVTGTFNICSGVAVSLKELIARLVQLSGHEPEIVSSSQLVRRHDIPVLCGDNTALAAATGWRPSQDIGDILASMIHHPSTCQ